MKKVKQINNWVIKKKRSSEIPFGIDDNKCYAVFSPTGIFMEDNLTLQQAEEFCRENKDFIGRGNNG